MLSVLRKRRERGEVAEPGELGPAVELVRTREVNGSGRVKDRLDGTARVEGGSIWISGTSSVVTVAILRAKVCDKSE